MEPILLTANDVLQFNAGDGNAFDKVYKAFFKYVFHITRRYLSDEDDARDITQETFITLWKHEGQFETGQNIKAFVSITARNACLNLIRNRIRANKELRKVADGINVAVDHEDFEEIERKELRMLVEANTLEVLTQAIAKLPEDKREAVNLYYFGNLTKVEIGQRCGISPTAAAKRLNKAIDLLRINLLPRNITFVFAVVAYFLKNLLK
ncbi:RNA polymerase sigma factor [Niastella sp. OAS944]|uniref:RNA polymerase sigma factor n=1 Tax=Niastella sp. OAS944 TaxID=2664089 RepID=UPI00347A19AC|nr:RNA polymerase sigma-70 factor (ECF subfamily) [Chitinophagaceae bacterium OAS944]